MKTLRLSFLLVAMLGAIVSFGQKKAEWKEQKDYHGVMAATFHPAEEGNFAPLKEKSGDLAKKAAAWGKSVYPVGYDKKAIAPILKKLVAESKLLDAKVKAGAGNEELNKLITALHDRFHEIAEKCNAGDHEGHEGH
ncbi:MAG: hypothetical protein V4722_05230 [Bacteroidota bacterium]